MGTETPSEPSDVAMRYVYVDESGSLGPGATATWVLARYVDPFEASQFVSAEWQSGAMLLNDLRRVLTTVLSVAAMASQPTVAMHREWTVMRRLIDAVGVKPRAECHATYVLRIVRQLNAWSDPAHPVAAPPLLPEHSRVGMDLACQSSVSGNLIAPLAQSILHGTPTQGRSTQLAALSATRDRIIKAQGAPADAVARFDLLLRCVGHGVLDAFERVLDVGLRSADRTVIVRVHGDAGIAANRQMVATQAITAGCRHLLGSRTRRRQATVLIDGEFRDGMKLTADLMGHDGQPLVTGVVPVNSQGTPLVWVSDAAANLFNREDGADPIRTKLRRGIVRRVKPHDLIEICTVGEWEAFARTPSRELTTPATGGRVSPSAG